MIIFTERTGRIALAILILLGLAIRFQWGLRQSSDAKAIDSLPDQREYLDLGSHLLQQNGLWFADARFLQAVYAYRTPGYPMMVRWCEADPRAIRIVQSILDASTILAIFLLARRWLSIGGALWAALLVAIDPYLIFFAGLILSETLFTAMLCWGLVLLILSDGPWPAGRKRWAWLGGGLLLALSVLVRPGAIALPVVLGCGAALLNRDIPRPYPSQRWPLPVAATLLLLTAVVLFPWALRNRWELGNWVWTTTNEGITRYDGFNPDATGASDQRFVERMPWTRDMTEVARSRYFTHLADEWVAVHPWAAIQLAGAKIARTWSPMPLSPQYGRRWLYVAAGLGFGAIFDLLLLAGLGRTGLPAPVKWVLLLPAIYFTLASALSVGSLRYLVPAHGPMAIIAASALCPAAKRSDPNAPSGP